MEPELSLSNFLNTAVTLESAAIATKVLIYKWQLPKCCITSSSKRRYRIILFTFFLAYLFYRVVFNVAAIVVGVVGDVVVVVGVQDWQSIRNNNFMDVLLGILGIQAYNYCVC